MLALTFAEIGSFERLNDVVNFGTLPFVYTHPQFARETLSSYVETYMKEEIAAEALTRNLEPFSRFLKTCAQYHGQLLNIEKIASSAAIKRTSVDNYFKILEDTLIGSRLPALDLGYRIKEASHPKFYFFDSGVARAAAGWLYDELPNTWLGFAFESIVLNEVKAYNIYRRKMREIFHYSVTGSFDIDIVVETQKKIMNTSSSYLGIEIKHTKRWEHSFVKNLNEMLSNSKSKMKAGYGVYLGEESFQDGQVTVCNFQTFCKKLWAGEIF